MFQPFHALGDRIKALFVADMALDLEAQLAARQADRQAELLVQAEQHDRHGFPIVAARLRAQAEALGLDRPLASVLPALAHWQADAPLTPALPTDVPPTDGNPDRAARSLAARRKDR